MKVSWRTTGLGIATIGLAICGAAVALLDGDPATKVDYLLFTSSITAGWGLIMARDNKVSSEQAGAK